MKIIQQEQSGLLLTSSSGFVLGIDIGNKTKAEKLVGYSCDAYLSYSLRSFFCRKYYATQA